MNQTMKQGRKKASKQVIKQAKQVSMSAIKQQRKFTQELS